MFLIIFSARNSVHTDLRSNLAHQQFVIDDHWQCSVHYDNGVLELDADNSEIQLTDAILQSGPIASISTKRRRFRITKPLLFGLPVYYTEIDGSIVICSHIRYMRELGADLEMSKRSLPEFFVFRYVCPPQTLIRNVSCLPIDSSLHGVLRSDRRVTLNLEWSKAFQKPEESLDISDGIQLTETALATGCRSLSSSAESVACLLSGGVDSSILFKLSADILGTTSSHSSGYPFEDQTSNGERIYATTAAEAFGADHTYHEYATDSFLHGIIATIGHAEMPLIHLQTVILDLLFRDGLSGSDKIILNGQGADGLYGLNPMYNYRHHKYMIRRPLAPLHKLASLLVSDSFFPFERISNWSKMNWSTDFGDPQNAVWLLGVFGDAEWTKTYFHATDEDIFRNRRNAVESLNVDSILDGFSALDFVSDVATTQDLWGKLSSNHGRRQYYAFNEPNVISAAQRVSWEQKLVEPKYLLRQVGRNIGVPDSILDRPKLGFGIRSERWSKPGGLMEPLLAVIAPEIDTEMVRRFQGSNEPSAMMYWNWLNLGIWNRLIINGEEPDSLHNELSQAIELHDFSQH